MRKDVIYLSLILLTAILLSSYSFVNLNFLPSGIDTPSHIFKVKLMEKLLREEGSISSWNPYWYGGSTFLALFPPYAYYVLLSFQLIFGNITLAYNIARLITLLLLPLTVYLFLKKHFKRAETAFIGAFLVLTSYPIFNNLFTIGRWPTAIALIFYFLSIHLFLSKGTFKIAFSKKALLFGISVALLALTHILLLYFLVFSLVIFILCDISKIRKVVFWKNSLLSLIVFLLITSPFFYTFINNFFILRPFWITITPKLEHIEMMYRPIFGDTYLLYTGSFHLSLFLIGAFLILYQRSKVGVAFLLNAILFLTLLLGKNTPFYSLIPFNEQFDLPRFQILFSLWASLIGAFSIKYLIEAFPKSRIYFLAVFIIVVLVIIDVIPAINETKNWNLKLNMSELSVDKNHRYLALGFRHWDSYIFPTFLNLQSITGWFQQEDPHYNFTQTLQSIGGLWYAHDDRFPRNENMALFKNLLRLSNTKYIIFGKDWYPQYAKETTIGTYQPDHEWNIRLKNLIEADNEFKSIYSSNTLEVFEYTKSFFYCEPVMPLWINDNYYNESVNFLSSYEAFPKIPVLGEPINLQGSLDTHVICGRESPEIIHINVDKPSWVLVKESYYPFWRAKSGTEIYNAFGFMVLYVNDTETLFYKML